MFKLGVQFGAIKWPIGLIIGSFLSVSAAFATQTADPALEIQKAIDDNQLQVAQELLSTAELSEFQRGYLQGWLSLKQQDSDAALEAWRTLRLRFPNSLELGNNLAVLLMQRKNFEEAQAILEQALHADRQVSKALDNLNKIYSFQAQQAYNNVFRRVKPEAPQGVWLALREDASDVVLVESSFSAQDAVLAALEKWRQAWSNKNVAGYLAQYHEEFVPAQSQGLRAWRNARTRSLTSPRFIDVFLSDVALTPLDDDLVRLQFTQRYRSDRYQDEVTKVILMKLSGNDWKIVQEIVTHEN